MSQLLKRWDEGTYDLFGQRIRLKVKAPLFDEAPEFLRKMTAFSRTAALAQSAVGTGDVEATVGGADSMFAAIDTKWARDVFLKCVVPIEPIFVEDDGPDAKPITTGAELYEIANIPLVLQVLYKVQRMAMLGPTEGKASASPSMSGAGPGQEIPDSGNSPAMSIEPVDGPTH